MTLGSTRVAKARAAAVRALAYTLAAVIALLAASGLSVELNLAMGLSGRTAAIAEGLSAVLVAILLAWTFLGAREPARALARTCKAGAVVSALYPLSVVASVSLRKSDWSELGGFALGLAVGFLLLLGSLVVNPGLCAVSLLAERALKGLPKPAGLPLAARRAATAYAALVVTCVLLGRYTPFVLPATAAATVGSLALMAWPPGPFAVRAGIGLAGPYAVLTGAAGLAAPAVAGVLWSVLARREG